MKYKLKEIGKIVSGGTPSTKKSDYYTTNGIGWITPKDLSNYSEKYIYHGARDISKIGLENSSAKIMPSNSILVSSRAPIGYVAMAGEPLAANQGFKSIIPDVSKVLPDYLYYLMLNSKNKLEQVASGSTFKEVSGKTMANFEVDIPKIQEQKYIVSLLNPIVKKVELNNRINDNLLLLLENIFNKFVEGKALNVSLSDICSITNEKVDVDTLTLSNYWSNTNLLHDKKGAMKAEKLPNAKRVNKVIVGDTLLGNIRPYFKKVFYPSNNGGASTDVVCFHPNNAQLSEYLFSIIYSNDFLASVIKSSKGTKMPRGDKKQMLDYQIYLPSQKEISLFRKKAKGILSQIQANNRENDKLNLIKINLLNKLF